MRPHDAITGWDDHTNAEQYHRFTQAFPLYQQTSRDLVVRASLHDKTLAVDLCGGTGVTAATMLDTMPAHGRVITIDSSAAMQAVGRRVRPDPRLNWVTSRAEDVDKHVGEPIAAVLCNAGIWKTDTPATFAAARRLLEPGGLLVFNIAGGFAGLANHSRTARHGPSLNQLIHDIAAQRYGNPPPSQQLERPALTRQLVTQQLQDNGFRVHSLEVVVHEGTVEEKKAWLSIPLFARPAADLTHEQRLAILEEAYALVDKNRPVTTPWLVVVAAAAPVRTPPPRHSAPAHRSDTAQVTAARNEG
ncbi:MAG TPA: methyltransferase domain-containing protein [Kineosporiaceae bacterium]